MVKNVSGRQTGRLSRDVSIVKDKAVLDVVTRTAVWTGAQSHIDGRDRREPRQAPGQLPQQWGDAPCSLPVPNTLQERPGCFSRAGESFGTNAERGQGRGSSECCRPAP
jgi:hypothetical protein